MVDKPKYDVGDILPNLIVTDADSQPTTLNDEMGDRGLLLFALRGTWCSFCVGQIHTMQKRYPIYQNMGVNSVFIVPEAHTKVWSFTISSRQPLPFGLHADERQDVTDSLTLTPTTPSERPLGIYLLNRDRKVLWRYVGFEADEYASQDALLTAINKYFQSDDSLEAAATSGH